MCIIDRTTVSKELTKVAGEERELLGEELKSLLNDGNISFTTDMCLEGFKGIPFVTVTAHYLDANWTKRSKIIFTTEFDLSKKKKQVNV